MRKSPKASCGQRSCGKPWGISPKRGKASIGSNRLKAVTPTNATKGEGNTALKRLGYKRTTAKVSAPIKKAKGLNCGSSCQMPLKIPGTEPPRSSPINTGSCSTSTIPPMPDMKPEITE